MTNTSPVGTYRRKHVDLAGLEREIGRDILQRFTSLEPVAVVRLREREQEAA